MKKSPFPFLVGLLLTAIISLGIGCSASPKEQQSDAATKEVVSTITPSANNADKPNVDKVQEVKDQSNTQKEPATEEGKPVQVNNTATPIAESGTLKSTIKGISDAKISAVLASISEHMEAKKLAYISSKHQDCSGIYHQIKDSLQARIPALSHAADYIYPDISKVRSSRQIADWYYQKGNLQIVTDPISAKKSIRPGAVMFFGRAGELFKGQELTIDKLTDRNNAYTKNGNIQHIAVVTAVQKNAVGEVEAYTMMHARYPSGPPASRSGSRAVQSNSAKNKAKVAPYPFGHWTQQWVAVANIATTAVR